MRIAAAQQDLDKLREKARAEQGPAQEQLQASIDSEAERLNLLHGEWKRQSYLGRMGQAVEPVVRPLGWDWRIGMAAIASFPAREVVVGTLGIIYNQGKVDPDEIREAEKISDTNLGRALQAATWDSDSRHRVFTVPVALSLMVFFALCCQCVSTLAIIRRETNSGAGRSLRLLT